VIEIAWMGWSANIPHPVSF